MIVKFGMRDKKTKEKTPGQMRGVFSFLDLLFVFKFLKFPEETVCVG